MWKTLQIGEPSTVRQREEICYQVDRRRVSYQRLLQTCSETFCRRVGDIGELDHPEASQVLNSILPQLQTARRPHAR